MIRILLATPLKGGLSPEYVRSLIHVLTSNSDGKYEFQWITCTGTSVALARNECVHHARTNKFDKIIFWDKDVGPMDAGLMLSMFYRLLSHDVEIVAGQYTARNFHSFFHGAKLPGEMPNENGLMKMGQMAIGFAAIDCKVFDKIEQTHPWLHYMMMQTHDSVPAPRMHEFFPSGIVGPNTGQGKVDRLNKINFRMKMAGNAMINDCTRIIGQVCDILNDSDYSTNAMLGEDFYFCRLAREAGFDLWIDNCLMVPHDTGVKLPVKNSDILTELGQQWRWSGMATQEQVEAAIEKVRSVLGPDNP